MSTELVTDVPVSDAVGALAPSEALPVDDVSNAVTNAVGQIKQQRDISLKGSLNQAVTVDPDKAAQNQALSDKTGVPVDVINRNEEEVQKRARVDELRALVSTSPVLEQQMFNPKFAALAHDDAENLSIFERTLRTYLGASTKSGLEQLLGVGAKLLDAAMQATGTGTSEAEGATLFKNQPEELKKFQEGPAMFFTRFAKAMQEASTESMKNLSPSAQLEYGDLRYATLDPSKAAYLSPIKVVGDAIQSLPTSLALGVSVYLTKGVAARTEAAALASGMSPALAREAAIHAGVETMARLGAATEGAAGYGQQYMQTRQQADEVTDEQLAQSPQYQQLVAAGYSPEAARLRLSAVAAEASGAAGGAVDAITNYFGGRFLGTILTEGGRLVSRTAKGFATEALTEAVQSGGEQLAQNVAVQQFLNPAQDALDQVAENIAQGFVVGGVTGGAFGAVAGAKQRQEKATHDAAVLTKLSEIAAQSELRARAPETFAQFVNAASAQGGVDAVWIDAKGFAQSMVKAGLDQAQLAQKMPETAAALPDALATNGKVRIPTGEFMATFPGTGVEKELIPQLSTTPEGPTAAEAHDAAFVAEAQKQVEAVLSKQEFTGAIKQSMGSVERELLGQLTTANRFTKDVNGAYAKLIASFYTVMGQRVGLTPEQMYVKYPLNIKAENVAGQTLTQPKTSNPVGWWEGPGGTSDIEETNHVPTLRERIEGFADDRRWHANPNYKPEVVSSNRPKAVAAAGETAPAVFSSNRQKQEMQAGEVVGITSASELNQPAYHGSPFDFEKFSVDHIGTGEGAAAYGHGLYFAENAGVAASYHSRLAGNPQLANLKLGWMNVGPHNGYEYTSRASQNLVENVRASLAEDLLINESDLRGAHDAQRYVLAQLDDRIKNYYDPKTDQQMIDAAKKLRVELAKPGAVSATFEKATGGVYTVDIPDAATARMILWDKPLKDQPTEVKATVRVRLKDLGYLRPEDNGPRVIYPAFKAWALAEAGMSDKDSGATIYEMFVQQEGGRDKANAERNASRFLAAQGVPGVRYLDQGSRDAAKGTHNLVVFDDSLITITHKDGVAAVKAIDYSQSSKQVSPSLWYYSALQAQVEALKVETAPANEWKKIIEGLSQKGVKKAEVEASGIMDWLDTTSEEIAGIKTDELPPAVKKEAEKTFSSDSDNNFLWTKKTLQPYEAEAYLHEGWRDDESFTAKAAKIGNAIAEHGQKNPVVISPHGIEGNHRLAAGVLLGIKINAYIAQEVKPRISRDEILAYLHTDGETEVRTTILGEPMQDGDVVEGEDDFSEGDVERRAEQMWRDNLQEEAEQYAQGSDYVGISEPKLQLPNFKIVELPADMLREEGPMYGVKELTWNVATEGKEMPTDKVELAAEGQPRESWVPLKYQKGPAEFVSLAGARDWANVRRFQDGELGREHDPYWTATDYEGNEIGEYEDKYDAAEAAVREQQQRYQSEVDDYIDNASWTDDSEHWMRLAREDLEEDSDRPRQGSTLSVVHAGQYQTKGGKNYREMVLWVPSVESFDTSDTTHFGHIGEGKGVVWVRYKTHEGADGKPVLFIDEIQPKRAQEGRETGFSDEREPIGYGVMDPRGAFYYESSFNTLAEAQAGIDNATIYKDKNRQFGGEWLVKIAGLKGEDDRSVGLASFTTEEDAKRYLASLKVRAGEIITGNVPTAPFVKDTQAWVALAMKRIVRYAVDHNIDRVAWTVGQQQIGFYTHALQTQIRELKWKKTDKGIEIEADGRNVNRTFSDKELRVAAGGDITDQIVNSPEKSGNISGQNIRFNATWPSQFYGNEQGQAPLTQREIDDLKKAGKPIPDSKPSMVTAVANKILAQMGGGKVETIPVQIELKGGRIGVGAFERERFVAPNQQPGFTITPQMKEAVLGKGFPLFQAGDKNRGGISFGEGIGQSPATIMLLQNADLSTFLHESGHFYLEVMNHMASQENAPPELKRDMASLLNWFGVKDMATWNLMTLDEKRPYHEQFARGFEAYLFEGTAPSPELKGIFARFRAWMLNVYRQLSALNVQLTDEVRGVLDRMLATNNEIIAAENQRGYSPLFDDAAKMGVSQDEWKGYQDLGTSATQDAVDTLQTRSLRDMKWLSNARNAEIRKLQASAARVRKGVRAEVAAEVNAQPIYQAMRWLKTGETVGPEGEAVKAEKGFKLDSAALATMYPATGLGNPDLTKLGVGKYGMASPEGLDPNLVAEMFGFSSGDELVRKLTDVEPARSVIEGMTDQRMLERYGDLTSQAAISAAADKAIHNELRAKVLATELAALTKATGSKKLLITAAREFAEKMIARKKVRDIRPAQYEAAEARAARAAQKAFTADKIVEAATEKRNELVNNYAAKAAHTALAEIDSSIAYLRKVADSKTIDPAYREQITAMLERFDLRQTTIKEAKRKTSLLEWMESQKDQEFEPVIDSEIANEAMRMPYQEMTMEQFRGLTDSVRNIEHLGRLKHKLLKLADQREFAATVDAAVAEINANAKKTLPVRLEGNTWSARMKDGVTEFFAMHRKFASLWREMDGFTDGGKLWQLFVRPMNDAGNTETTMREAATIEMQRIFEPLFTAEGNIESLARRAEQVASGEFNQARKDYLRQKKWIPEINASLSREGRIMVALNIGNDGNLQRLMDGDHWTKKQVDAIVDTLSKTEMDFVQATWDMIGAYKKQIGDLQKRLTGLEPEWVEPRQVITQHGVYAGGYLPAKYDTTRSTRALADEAAAGIMDQWRGKRGIAKTRDSFTKERASKVVNRPLRKDFGVVTQHITEVIHRLSWQEYLTDANRLLRSRGIDTAIRDHYGPETLAALSHTLEDIATGELPAQNAFERSINYIRQGATIAGLGWRLTTALLQPFGLTQSMVRIGPKYVARGIAEWLGDSIRMENTAKHIYEKSEFMRLRAKTMQREINEIRNQVEGKNTALVSSYFYLITKMQLVADIPTWLGQYHKSIEGGADEMNARAQADQAVIDAQGSGQIKDLSAIQRGGPMMKLFTNFYSFFNTTYNMTAEAYGRTNFKNPLSIGRLMVDILLLYSIPAALGTFMKAALHSGDDTPDWEDKLVRQLIADQMTYMLGTMVGLREISGAAQTALGLTGDYQGPASVRLFASIAEFGKQINQGEIDEALLKAADNVGGVLFHYPAGQINATVDGLVTMGQGKTDNPGALLVGSNRK